MSKLFNLKEWLTLTDAAKHLSIIFGENVSEADILRLAIDGYLKLSLFFVNNFPAKPIKKELVSTVQKEVNARIANGTIQLTYEIAFIRFLTAALQSSQFSENDKYEEVQVLSSGEWWLVMNALAFMALEQEYQNVTYQMEVNSKTDGLLIKGDYDYFYEVQTLSPNAEIESAKNFLPDSFIVIRTDALGEFESELYKAAKKPDSTRKTENLLQALTCVAIDAYGYDPKSEKSTAPSDIANALSVLGKGVDPKTIRGWLKEGAALLPPSPPKD